VIGRLWNLFLGRRVSRYREVLTKSLNEYMASLKISITLILYVIGRETSSLTYGYPDYVVLYHGEMFLVIHNLLV
jgi:hypothetical protein